MDFDLSVSKSFKTVKDEIVIVLIVQLGGEFICIFSVSVIAWKYLKSWKEMVKSAKHLEHLRWTAYFSAKKKKKNEIKKTLQLQSWRTPGGELNDLPNLISHCVYLPE